jgi:phage major head subunit gpT-like protein
MPSPLTPADVQKAFIGFDLSFRKALSDAKPSWNRIASLKTSDTEQEVYPWLDVIPEMREFLGEREIVSVSARSQTLVNKLFERTIGIKRTKLEDDKIGVYADWLSELGRVAALWPDAQVTAALKAANATICHDGQYFFDTDHPVNMDDPTSATQSNDLDYSVAGAGGSQPGLTPVNLADARAKMRSFLNASGVPYDVNADLVVTPPQLEYQAKTILNAETIAVPVAAGPGPGGVGTQQNVLKGTMDQLTLPRLQDQPGYVYLLETKRAVKPLIWQQRSAPEFAYLTSPNDPEAFKRDEFLAGVRARGAAGVGLWFLACRVKVA